MAIIVEQSAELTAHPSTPNAAVRSLGVQLRAAAPDLLVFQYSLVADMSRVRIPASGAGGRAEALWTHTCFEAFMAPANAPGYHELNFSPSLNWALYRFSDYRKGMSPAEAGQAPKISVRRGEDGLELQATLHMAHLPELRDAPGLRIALSAVIEDEHGRLSYWSLRHAPGKPDFHHSHGFALELPAHEIWH